MGMLKKTIIIAIAIVSSWVVVGCSGNSPSFVADGGADTDSDTDVALPDVQPSDETLAAADPKLVGFESWPIVFTVDPKGYTSLTCRVEIARGDTAIAAVDGTLVDGACTAVWDGRDAEGGWVAPGQATATAFLFEGGGDGGDPLAQAETVLEVVRLGFGQIQMAGVESTQRVALLWGETDGEAEGYYEVTVDDAPWRIGPDASEDAAAVDLDLADGTPRTLPLPWTDLKSPPLDDASSDGVEHDSFNYPTAWVAGADIAFSATMSASAAGMEGGGGPVDVEIRVVPPAGTEVVGADAFSHGAVAVVQTTASPVPAVGSYEIDLVWGFEARRPAGEWAPIPGSVTTTHRLYGVVGQPQLGSYTGIQYRAWIEVVDAVAGWVGGATADPVEVASDITQGIFETTDLTYDTQYGACTYTEYLWGNWTNGTFDIVGFQRRDKGDIVNCSDCAGILSTYANMVGVDFTYHILQNGYSGFDLNYIMAIGFTVFDETPFDDGGGGFNYHAVTGPSDGTIYDATLKLDGDGTPTAAPFEEIFPVAMSETDYLFDLSSQWTQVDVDYSTKVRLQNVGKLDTGSWATSGSVAATPLRAGIPVSAVAPDGMTLLSTAPPPAADHPVALAFGEPSRGEPAVLVDVLVADDAAIARAALEAFLRTSARSLPPRKGIGDAGYGGAGAFGFTRDNVMIVYRSLDGDSDAEALAGIADAAVLAAPFGRATADRIPAVESEAGQAGDPPTPVRVGDAFLSSRAIVDGPAYARRTEAGWLIIRTGEGPIRAEIVAVDDRLRVTP